MTIDLSTARVGSEVTTHAGAKLVIERCEPNEWGIKFWFSGYTGWFIYQPDGAMSHAPRPNPMDIIAISPPPMSDAERLLENETRFAQIAALASDWWKSDPKHSAAEAFRAILDVAEGKRT